MAFATVDVATRIDQNRFRNPVDLPLFWIENAFNHTVEGLIPTVIITLLVGGAISGICSYGARLRWT